jgi:hypothetical protein
MKTKIIGKNGLEDVNLNRRTAIHERCLNCACWHPQEVKKCDFTKCPLYQFRTGDGKQDAVVRNQAIRDYCRYCMNGQAGEVTKCPSNNCSLYVFRRGRQQYTEEKMIVFYKCQGQEQRL